jgi:hypothetical protein
MAVEADMRPRLRIVKNRLEANCSAVALCLQQVSRSAITKVTAAYGLLNEN